MTPEGCLPQPTTPGTRANRSAFADLPAVRRPGTASSLGPAGDFVRSGTSSSG